MIFTLVKLLTAALFVLFAISMFDTVVEFVNGIIDMWPWGDA